MGEYSDYQQQMNRQELRLHARSPQMEDPDPRPSAQKNLGSLFGSRSNPSVVSLLYSRLNPHLLEGKKLDPSAPRHTLLDTIQTLADEGELPDDEIMVDVLAAIDVSRDDDVR